MNPKLQMLQDMLAGKPTRETQELSVKTLLYSDEKNMGKIDEHVIQSLVEDLPLPDMTGVQLPNVQRPVSEDDIMVLMSGKRPKPNERPVQHQQQQVRQLMQESPVEEDYWSVTDTPIRRQPRADVEREPPQISIEEQLRRKLNKGGVQQKQSLVEQARTKTAPLPTDDLTDMIEDIVYKVLAQIVNEAVKRKMGR